jgi:hypothetical protein
MDEEGLALELRKLGLKEHDVVLITIRDVVKLDYLQQLHLALQLAIKKIGLEKVSYIITSGDKGETFQINNYDVIKMFKMGWLKLDPAIFAMLVEADLMTREEMNKLKDVLRRIVENNGEH